MLKSGRPALLTVLLLVLTAIAIAEPVSYVKFNATVTPAPAHSGEVVTVTVHAVIEDGWHLYSSHEIANGPIASELYLNVKLIPLTDTLENAAHIIQDPNFGRVGVHTKNAVFSRQYRVSRYLPSSVQIKYQLCNDKVCIPPSVVSVPIDLKVTAGPVRAEYAKPNPVPPILSASESTSSTPSEKSDSGLGLFLLAAVLAGLLSIITPCVFPLIPITLTSFIKQADGDRKKLARISGGYSLGIVLMYASLGMIVSATLGAAGINRAAANPWINLLIFALFVLFAFSFFEVIEIRLPASLGAIQNKARLTGGTPGLILLGVAFVLASFTCTAPFVGTLLVTAAQGARLRPLLGLLAFGVAFVSPFLLFTIFPQWISRIPRSGVWLARTKATLGFVELAASLKFLSNADQVWQWKILIQPVLLGLWAVIGLCTTLYLLGFLRFGVVAQTETAQERKRISITRGAFALLFAFFAIYCVRGIAGRPINPYMASFLPPAGYGGYGIEKNLLPWMTDYTKALEQARTENKKLLVDFTGYTCTNCRLNEKNVFPHSDVQREMAQFVRVQLYTDGGPDGSSNQKLQERIAGDVALPLYLVIDPQSEKVISKVEGVTTPADFIKFLQAGE